MIFTKCDVCGRTILDVNAGLCRHCYYTKDHLTKCDECGVDCTTSGYMTRTGLCYNCYYVRELFECKDCGREITKFDYDDYDGTCGYCHDDCGELS